MIKGYSAISTSLWHHVASSKHRKGYHEAFPVVNINQRSKLGIRSNLFTTPFSSQRPCLGLDHSGRWVGLRAFAEAIFTFVHESKNLEIQSHFRHEPRTSNYSKFSISEVVLCQQWGPATGKTHAKQTPSVFRYCIHFALGFSSELKNVQNAANGRSGYICCHAEGHRGFEIAWENLGQ